MELYSHGCCGVREIADLSAHKTAEGAMKALCAIIATGGGYYDGQYDYLGQPNKLPDVPCKIHPSCAYFIFTGASLTKRPATYAARFAKYIETNGLGTIDLKSRPQRNLSHGENGRFITVYLWHPDREAIAKWWDERRGKE